jgi:Mycothiol maleylpyruvate isomerase N-terminal domain
MNPVREAYLEAAASALALISAREVAAAWHTPSALTGFRVDGLAGHLAWQVLCVPRALAATLATGPDGTGPISLDEHYARSRWLDSGIDDESNVGIRSFGEDLAADGADALTSHTGTVLAELRAALPAEAPDRTVRLPWAEWSLTLDDLLITRTMEIAVHADDLAVSVGVATPALAPAALAPVFDLLTRLAVRRHGPTAVLRALSRAERAPATISAF